MEKTKPYTSTARFKRLAKEYLKEDARLAKEREKIRRFYNRDKRLKG